MLLTAGCEAPSGDPSQPPVGSAVTAAGTGHDRLGAVRALDSLVEEVRDRARAAPGTSVATQLDDVLTNARALHVTDFTARYVDEGSPDGTGGAWSASVALTWRFAGFDEHPVAEQVEVGFATDPSAGGVQITSIGGPGAAASGRRAPLWLSGPLHVRRDRDTLVLATSSADADRLARRARRAVAVVRRVLPSWPGRLVVEVPGSETQLDEVLGAAPDSYAGIAAVTASVDGGTSPGAPVHVFVNPTLYDAMGPVGRQVVLSHEATHVATGSPLVAGMAPWLVEGFADYVALRDVDLPLTVTARDISAQVRRTGQPGHLPVATDFGAGQPDLGATYQSAWLLSRVLAEGGGEAALVRLYEQVAAGQPLRARLRSDLGLTVHQLLHRWQRRLRQLARAADPTR